MRFAGIWRRVVWLAWASMCGQAAIAGSADGTAPDLARRIVAAADHGGRPFAVVDKHTARLAVYFADGRLAGMSPVLLGTTPGDRSVPGVRERTQRGQLRPDDRTTPAGRFVSQPGRNLDGETVIWVDYASAFAIHRLRPGAAHARRVRGLASADPADRRLSAGCVVVPVPFYEAVVEPLLGRGRGMVYVLPEEAEAGGSQDL